MTPADIPTIHLIIVTAVLWLVLAVLWIAIVWMLLRWAGHAIADKWWSQNDDGEINSDGGRPSYDQTLEPWKAGD